MTTRHLALALALALVAPAGASTAELRATARQLSASHRDAVVWLSVISKTTMGTEGDVPAQLKASLASQAKEEKNEVTGTVVDASGLIVTALGGLDKSSLLDGQSISTPVGEIKLKAESEIKEVKVITADGTEIPADLVLKDQDLGLAFIKVRTDSDEAKGVEFKAIDLADAARGELLDECIALGRLDESLNREPSLVTSEISGITVRPRVFYRVAVDSVGSPVFLASGKLLGISVLRQPRNGAAASNRLQLTPVVLPAADVAKVAAQAREAKPAAPPASEEPANEDPPAAG